MNKSAFLHLIRNASSISAQEAEELEELVVNFPYCQTAHLLIAKSAYDRGSMLSNQKLRKAASYATNRQLLKKLIYTTAADVTLKEVSAPAVAEETQVPSPDLYSRLAAPETAPLNDELEQTVEEPREKGSTATESSYEAAFTPEEEADEPAIGEIIFEEAEKDIPGIPEVETDGEIPHPAEPNPVPFAQADQITAGERELRDEELNLEEEPTFVVLPPEAATDKGPAQAADNAPDSEEEKEDPEDELAGLLYIDRIMPYRHLLPEHKEAAKEEEEKEPIPLAQFANPSLTEEEVSALEELIKSDQEPDFEPGSEADTAEDSEKGEEDWAPAAQMAAELAQISGGEAIQEIEKEAEPVEEETLARFDAFLFHPERDSPEQAQVLEEEEEVTATYPADVIDRIYAQNQLGYWMNSSRLGESLEVKNELTSAYPFYFHPELILEYVQVNEVEKLVKPADSPLDQQLDLIDQFLKMNPRLKQFGDAKIRTEPQEDLSFKSSKIKKNLASENLANIFLKQGKIKKAIKIYEHLIVKIPEKKAYFADQIMKLKNLS